MVGNVKKTSHDRLVITGPKNYVYRMFYHLRKEHPSTKRRMVIRR
jgi:hypothetical protein